MTVLQPTSSAAEATAPKEPDPIWVDAAVRVIAAGIRGGKARATLVLTPVLSTGTKETGALNLNEWPREVALAVAGGVQVAVSPVMDNGLRPTPKSDANTVTMMP